MAPRTRGQTARENSPEKAAAATPAKAPRATKTAAKKNTPRKTALKRAAEIVETEQVEVVESTVQTPLKESSTDSSVSIRSTKHVEIEIPLPTSASKIQDPDTTMEGESQIFQTPTEQPRGKKITFDDSEEEFVTPREAPEVNPLEARLKEKTEEKEQEEEEDSEEEDSDDEAPEAVSTSAAQAKLLEAERAAQKAAEQ